MEDGSCRYTTVHYGKGFQQFHIGIFLETELEYLDLAFSIQLVYTLCNLLTVSFASRHVTMVAIAAGSLFLDNVGYLSVARLGK